MRPSDPLYASQWHFKLMGNIEKIWDDYNGSGVTVNVYDEGVQYTHPDLVANFDLSTFFSYNGVTYDPAPLNSGAAHGTACAGLIGAVANDGIGGVGVAPGVMLSAVNYLDDIQNQTMDVYDAAMLYAANFDVMSNSWGWDGLYTFDQNLAKAGSAATHDMALWKTVVETGRGGLGTIILKAAGNETHNVNGDGWNASRFTLTISATGEHGNATSYTNFGSAVLIAGPASAVTTDLTGDDGYNIAGNADGDTVDPNYTETFNGTSAATPTVAGVVALMLEANANLGWRDVENILGLSAHHTGSALGGTATTYEQGTWDTMGGDLWNGGGTEYHQSYGYGMVDAFAAVRFAEAWSVIYAGNPQTSANEQSDTVTKSNVNVPIDDAGGEQAVVNMTSTANISVESITINLKVTHTYAQDLNLYLKTPDGQMISIYSHDGDGTLMDSGLRWSFTVDCLRGYSAAGTWSVVAEDTESQDTGTINSAQLIFYGSADSVNDVHNFTQDFGRMANFEADRRVLTDTNGGKDWLNFASIESNMTISMAASGVVKFGATVMAHMAAGAAVFENLFAGDGADRIDGNGLGNIIWGARGGDVLNGGNGNDTLNGGVGADSLLGQNGTDYIKGGDGNDTINGGAGHDILSGQAGKDSFVFTVGAGQDDIKDWQNDVDTLKIDDAIYGGGMTVADILSTFAHVTSGSVVIDLGDVEITLKGLTSISGLSDDITII